MIGFILGELKPEQVKEAMEMRRSGFFSDEEVQMWVNVTVEENKKESEKKSPSKVFENIVKVTNACCCDFQLRTRMIPNRVIMNDDVFGFMKKYLDEQISCAIDTEKYTFMGMDIEVVHGKPGFIEVGYVHQNSVRVNVNYQERRGGIDSEGVSGTDKAQ